MYSRLRCASGLLLGLSLALSCRWADAQENRTSRTGERPSFQQPPNAPKFAPDRVLVRFRPGTDKSTAARTHAALRAQAVRAYKSVRDLELVHLPAGLSVGEALSAYRKDPSVLYAEPDYVVHVLQNPVTPNDPRYAELWNLRDIHAPEAWGLSTGSPNVVVGVIDTGIDYNHEDLNANMFRNPLDCNNNGVDDDGNGYVDDCYGIDTANNDSDPMDDQGHGTHVAGTIGAAGNNGIGVVGVNWQVKLIACKFLGADGSGYDSDAITCLEYMATMKDRGVNIVATNNSWGGGDFSQALLEAIDTNRQRGILFIASAGNDGSDNDTFASYPSGFNLPNIIAVSATTSSDTLSSFSNYGRRSVHVAAPGSAILSTTPGNTYNSFSGTSMAAPHVTGVAALLAAQDLTRDWKAIKNLILAGGDTFPAMAETISQKRLDAYGAMTCLNSIVRSRLLPRTSSVYSTVGEPLILSALHINCALPNGTVQVSVDSGAAAVNLSDDGSDPDQAAEDGIYSGQIVWTVADIGDHTLTFPNNEVVTVHVIPHLSPYVFSTAVPYQLRSAPVDGDGSPLYGGLLHLGDDDAVLVTTPFPIQFGGASFISLYVGSNGIITFTDRFTSAANTPLPAAGTRTLVAPFWYDLYPPPGDIGRSPVRWYGLGNELVIEWSGVRPYDCQDSSTATVGFQVVFTEGSSDILFNYADATFGSPCEFADLGANATVGVQVEPGLATQFSFDSPSLSDHTSILWTLGQLAPTITRVSPFTAVAGDPGFTLRAFGTNFFSGSVVHWNGGDRPTTFVSSTELKAEISASDLTSAATAQIAVYNPPPNGGGSSAEAPFKVYSANPVPSLTALAPTTLQAPAANFTLNVTGSDFISGSIVRWNGSDRPTTVLSNTQATTAIPESDLADGGLVQVAIFNPAPGGGTSNALTFTLENRVPFVTQVEPYTAAVGVGFILHVIGSNFVPSSVIRWGDVDHQAAFVSSTELTASVTSTDVNTPGDIPVTVVNPAPGGGTSNASPVTVYASYPTPSLTSLNPSKVFSTGEPLTLTATGSGLVSASVVRWNGADRITKVLNSTQAQAQIPARDVADGSIAQVTVFTPAPGGGLSNPLAFTVENFSPLIGSIDPTVVVPGAGFTLAVSSGDVCAHPSDDPCYSTFMPSTVVRWNGASRPTTFINGGLIQAAIPASDVAAPGAAQITVFNPTPGGGTSNTAQIAIVPRPPNDNFADAITISTLPFTHTVDTPTATIEPADLPFMGHVLLGGCLFTATNGQPARDARAMNTVWYRFTPSTTTTARANMIGTNYWSVMAVLTGAPGSLTLVHCTQSEWSPPFNEHVFTAIAGQTYYFLIGAILWRSGWTLVFNLSDTPNSQPTFDFPATPPASMTIRAGQPAQFAFTVNPQNGAFNNAINFSCTSGVPPLSSCSFLPTSVTPGTNSATTTLTIVTTAPSAAAILGSTKIVFAFWFSLPALLMAGLVVGSRGSRRRRTTGLTLLALAVVVAMAACAGSDGAGGGNATSPRPGTTPGTYNVTVTGTSGTTTRSTIVTLVVE